MNTLKKRKRSLQLRARKRAYTIKEAVEKAGLPPRCLNELKFAICIGELPTAGLNAEGEYLIDFNDFREYIECGKINKILFPNKYMFF